MRVALYPGSFDPVTNGHLDVLTRALAVFDRVVVAVLANPRKTPLLPTETRVVVLETAIRDAGIDADQATVVTFDGLTVDAAHAHEARWIVRGLRAISDFETEMQLAHNNRALAEDVDTVFFMTAVENGYVSSSLVKEIAHFGGDVSSMIPPAAVTALRTLARDPRAATR
jgi:pantetheine-phosphate adenylyltransferase